MTSHIPESFINELKNKNGDFPDDWFNLYPVGSESDNGENLFTIYMNYGVGIHHMDKFLQRGYQLQTEMISPRRWDNIVFNMSKRNDFGEKLQEITNRKDTNPAYILLTLPTCHKFNLFFLLHKQDYTYVDDKKDIMNEMFANGAIDFHYSTNYYDFKEFNSIPRWKETMTHMVKCLKFMAKEKLIPRESLEKLGDQDVREQFINHIFYMQESAKIAQEKKRAEAQQNQHNMLQPNVNIQSNVQGTLTALGIGMTTSTTGSNQYAGSTISMDQEGQVFLKNLRSTLGRELFEASLTAKAPETRRNRGKI